MAAVCVDVCDRQVGRYQQWMVGWSKPTLGIVKSAALATFSLVMVVIYKKIFTESLRIDDGLSMECYQN